MPTCAVVCVPMRRRQAGQTGGVGWGGGGRMCGAGGAGGAARSDCAPARGGRHLGQREGVSEMEEAVHVRVWKVSEELALWTSFACASRRQPCGDARWATTAEIWAAGRRASMHGRRSSSSHTFCGRRRLEQLGLIPLFLRVLLDLQQEVAPGRALLALHGEGVTASASFMEARERADSRNV